jgi:hypothetical protein
VRVAVAAASTAILFGALRLWGATSTTAVQGCFLGALLASLARPALAPPRDFAWARACWFRWCPVAVALVATYPTLRLSCVADDWELTHQMARRGYPWEAFAPIAGAPWYRPVGWLVWWGLAKLAPGSGAAAHGVAVALFAACVALAPGALRRLGVPRGVARVGALLFAASPTALDTVAWAANIYSLLSLGFALLAIRALPRRGGSLRWLPAVAFTTAACLSKEEALMLPAWAALAGAGGRRRRWKVGIRAGAIVGIAAAIALGWRLAALGGLGGYVESPGGLAPHILPSFQHIATVVPGALPGQLLFPLRRPLADAWLAPAALVALFLVSVAAVPPILARRTWRPGLALVFVSWIPVLGLVKDEPGFTAARLLFLSSFFACAVAAAWIAECPGADRWHWAATIAVAGLALLCGRSNLRAWIESSDVLESTRERCGRAARAAPPNAKILVEGLPSRIDGAICFGDDEPFALGGAGGRPDIEWVGSIRGFGSLAMLLEIEPVTRAVRNPFAGAPARLLAAGETWSLDGTRPAARDSLIVGSAGVDGWTGGGPLVVWGTGFSACVAFPTIGVPEGAELEIACDASASLRDGSLGKLPLVATIPNENGLTRMLIDPGTYRLPPGATRLRLELNPAAPMRVELRRIAVTVR